MLSCTIYKQRGLRNNMNEGVEKIQSGKKILKGLESEGAYIFHGSPFGNTEMLEPRQALEKGENDGNPAVSGSPYADIAIFRSIINEKIITDTSYSSSFGYANGQLFFKASSNILENLNDKKGYVYVFNKSDFEPYDRNGNVSDKNMEWRSYKPLKPVRVVEVNFDDMPDMEKIIIDNK